MMRKTFRMFSGQIIATTRNFQLEIPTNEWWWKNRCPSMPWSFMFFGMIASLPRLFSRCFFFPRLKLHKTQIDLSCSSQTMTFFFLEAYTGQLFLGWFHTPIHWNQGITRLANAMKLLRQWAHPNFQKWSQGCRKMSLQQTLVYIYIQGKLPPLQLLPMILHSKIFHICNFAIYCDLFGDTWWCPVVPNWKGRNGDLQLFWGGSFIEFFFLVWWPVFGLLVSFCRFKESKWSFLATSGGLNDVCFLVNFWGVNIHAGSMVQNHAMSSTCPFFVCCRHFLN